MDMLYRAYGDPWSLIRAYVNQGRFGAFVQGFLESEYERRKAEIEKEEHWILWTAYIHSDAQESFGKYKERIMGKGEPAPGKSDADLNDESIMAIINEQFS